MTSTLSSTSTIGIIGAGRMGFPIIGHLVRKGFATYACDLDLGKRSLVVERGAQWAANPQAIAQACDVILGRSTRRP